jgi:hypothetical protein
LERKHACAADPHRAPRRLDAPQNLSETVDTPALFEHFRKYGEILQCKTDMDIYKQVQGCFSWSRARARARVCVPLVP